MTHTNIQHNHTTHTNTESCGMLCIKHVPILCIRDALLIVVMSLDQKMTTETNKVITQTEQRPSCEFLYMVSGVSVHELTMYRKHTAIVVINAPKKASSFRSPADSRNRKVKVSMPVINTPAHRGTL
jgi:hypothetical protein